MASCTDRTALADRYRRAAKMIEDREQEYGCYALKHAGLDCCALEEWFKEDSIAYGEEHEGYAVTFAYFGNAARTGEDFDDVVQGTRIVALCLLASMVEAGDA